MTVIDWTNPCARAQALREAYFRVVSGGQETEIVTRTLDAEERVRFSPADLTTLRAEMQAAEDECLRSQGLAPRVRRFAIRGGAVRRFGPFNGC